MAEGPRDQTLAAAWAIARSATPATIGNVPAAARAIAAGASPEDIALVSNSSAYEAIFELLFHLFADSDVEASDLRFIHEELLSADPTGREGSDLFA